MDLEIAGRHALLFDDDATAEVVNCGGSLVPWAAAAANLLLDRHDVRHLLDRVPPRPRLPYSAALLSAPSPDGVSEADVDRERFLDLPDDDGCGEGLRDASPSGNETGTGQAHYYAVPFSYGSSAGSDDPNNSSSHYCPSFPVPESLLNKLPPSEKVHQIIARTALFVNEHGGQSEIVLRVKQGSNPKFGFLMPDHHLHSYFRYLLHHPQLSKDGADPGGTNKGYKTVNSESEHAASSGGALSLLGAVYESGDEDEGTLPASSKGIDLGNDLVAHEQVYEGSSFVVHDNKEVGKGQTVNEAAATEVKGKPIFTKKNPMFAANRIVAAHLEKAKDSMTASTTAKSQNSKSGVSDTKEVILEPPSFLKRTMEKIVEFIIRNGKEFEEKLIEQDRTTGRFPFLLPSNPYHSYYLKILQETEETNSRGGSSERKDRRSSSERKDRRSSSEHKDSSRGKERTKSKARASTSKDSSASDRSCEEPSEKQLYDKQAKGKFQMVIGGVKKEPPRKVTADEAAAIVMAATRGLGPANFPPNTLKDTRDIGHTCRNNGHTSSFGSFSSLQDPNAASKPASNSEAGTSLTSSGQLRKESIGSIDDDWIANTIAKATAVAASKEEDSSEASITKEQKLKAERLRRAKMFAAIIRSGGNKMTDLATTADPTNEPAKASPADLNLSVPDPQPSAEECEGSSLPFEREGSNLTKEEKDSDDEQNKGRKYRKKHLSESSEEKDDLEESYKHSRKKHRSEHSRGHSKDVHKHKHRRHSKDRVSRHHRHHHSSSEDEREHRSSKSRHRHRDDHHCPEDDEHRRSHRHRRDHRSSSKSKHEDDRDHSEQTLGHPEASQSTSGRKFDSGKPPTDTAQSSQETTEVPSELRAKIRAMLLETL